MQQISDEAFKLLPKCHTCFRERHVSHPDANETGHQYNCFHNTYSNSMLQEFSINQSINQWLTEDVKRLLVRNNQHRQTGRHSHTRTHTPPHTHRQTDGHRNAFGWASVRDYTARIWICDGLVTLQRHQSCYASSTNSSAIIVSLIPLW